MKTIACYNIKGGVGKTATAINLAYLASREGARTLILDLDPQGAASFYLQVTPKLKGGVKSLIDGKQDLTDLIKATNHPNLDLIPTDFSFRNMDLKLEEENKPTQRLRKALKPMSDEYDYIFLDCPPSISLVSENVFQAADALLVPTIPTTLSLRTLEQLLEFCREAKLDKLRVLPFFSMVDIRKNLHRLIVESPPKPQKRWLHTTIPYASEVEKMGLHCDALPSFAPNSRSALAYESLWKEVKNRLK